MFNTSFEISGLVISIFLIKVIPHLLKDFVKQSGPVDEQLLSKKILQLLS